MNLSQQLLDGDGHVHGCVRVVFDVETESCQYTFDQKPGQTVVAKLNSLDEINGAAATHVFLAGSNTYSEDIVAALRNVAAAIRAKRFRRSS